MLTRLRQYQIIILSGIAELKIFFQAGPIRLKKDLTADLISA
jgi:hypothetical protein